MERLQEISSALDLADFLNFLGLKMKNWFPFSATIDECKKTFDSHCCSINSLENVNYVKVKDFSHALHHSWHLHKFSLFPHQIGLKAAPSPDRYVKGE